MTNSEDEAAAQLQNELSRDVLHTFNIGVNKPVLKHLNEDTSWLLSLPYGTRVKPPPGRCRYNILIDPWFKGEQHDLAAWFSTQWHATPSCVQTVAELNFYLQEAEESALSSQTSSKGAKNPRPPRPESFIDLVICSHEFEDHTHEPTLREVNPKVPVLAVKQAASIIRRWQHFETVAEIPIFHRDFHWQSARIPAVPAFLRVARMQPEMFVHLHTALLIAIGGHEDENAEVIVYTPHGVEARYLEDLSTAVPALRCLALIHGLNAVSLAGTRLNLGLANGEKAQNILRSKYWVATHDEMKIARGLVAPLLRWNAQTFYSVPENGSLQGNEANLNLQGAKDAFVQLASGQSIVLE